MTADTSELTLESMPCGKSKFCITARLAGKVVHVDELNPASAKQRERFIKSLTGKCPAADPAALDEELLRLTAAPKDAPNDPPALKEMDNSRIVRPEYFTTPECTGLSIPVVIDAGGKPSPR